MAYVINLPENGAERICVLDTLEEMDSIIENRMGYEFTSVYKEIVADWEYEHDGEGDDYEGIADGYLQELINIREELDAILSKKRIDRKALEMLLNNINNYT